MKTIINKINASDLKIAVDEIYKLIDENELEKGDIGGIEDLDELISENDFTGSLSFAETFLAIMHEIGKNPYEELKDETLTISLEEENDWDSEEGGEHFFLRGKNYDYMFDIDGEGCEVIYSCNDDFEDISLDDISKLY